jgi:hypothetical protein
VAASDEVMNNTTLERAIRSTNPLSVIMQEKVESLRVWARARCVFAD